MPKHQSQDSDLCTTGGICIKRVADLLHSAGVNLLMSVVSIEICNAKLPFYIVKQGSKIDAVTIQSSSRWRAKDLEFFTGGRHER